MDGMLLESDEPITYEEIILQSVLRKMPLFMEMIFCYSQTRYHGTVNPEKQKQRDRFP